MSNLPSDLVAEVLCRLSVKKLLHCRSVCKPWRSLIDDPDFIKRHIEHSIETSSNLSIVVGSNLLSIDFDGLNNPIELDPPLICYNHKIKVFGSCNGLLCIRNVVDHIALWNPSTRKHVVLPPLSLDLRRYSGTCDCTVYVYGFGYDPANDDYKVVRIAQFVGTDFQYFESEVMVYSLRRRCWKRIEDMNYYLHYRGRNGVYAGGALHWVVTRGPESRSSKLIVSLDRRLENFREVPEPENMDRNFDMGVGVLRDCLCLLAYYKDSRVDLWLMKEYGIKTSWSKLFSVSEVQPFRYLRPLAFSKSGRECCCSRITQICYGMIWLIRH
ncbi:F-box protein CPR30-like [Tripterygium wilfordii]|uniref:F-box protein CPR30-like n=1 Tax=Tripterygium wilfordii TaxID=458696 RepID=A0A7J7C3Z0_TRIWF|nr:F-box protein CPR30-like [Tripterygium wilfordii]